MADRDQVLERLHRTYRDAEAIGNQVDAHCYLTGSMAIYLLCKQLGIDVGDFVPRDVDFLLSSKTSRSTKFRSFMLNQRTKTTTYNKGTLDEFEIITRGSKKRGIIVESQTGNDKLSIMVLKPQSIKIEYVDQLNDARQYKLREIEEEQKIQRKIDLLDQILTVIEENNIKFTEVHDVVGRGKENKRVNKELKF